MATMKKTDVKKRGKIGYGQYWQSELYEEVMNTYRAIDDTVDSIGRIINEMQTQTGRNWDTEPDVPKWFGDVLDILDRARRELYYATINKSDKKSKDIKKFEPYSVGWCGEKFFDARQILTDCFMSNWTSTNHSFFDRILRNGYGIDGRTIIDALTTLSNECKDFENSIGLSTKKSAEVKTKIHKENVTEIEVNGEPYFIWESFNGFKGSKENPDQYITNARAVLDFNRNDGFESIQDVIDYINQYFVKSTKKSKPVAKIKTDTKMSFEDNVNKMRQHNHDRIWGKN